MNRRPQQQVKKVGGLVPTGVPLETLLPDGWRVTVAPEFVPVLEPQELVDFLNADDREARVLGEGRNRVLRRKLPRVPGTDSLDVAIKAFPPRSVLHDRIAAGRGTKARRAFDAAEFLRDHGVGTPGPIACVEHWRKRRLTGSWLVTVFVDGCRDFKSVLIDCFSPGVECAEIMARLETVARAIRRMHDAGFLHRDLGNQNILIPDDTERDVLFMDLNRGRIQKPLSPAERGRDLSRIYLPSDLLRVFIDMYWGDVPPPRLLASERFHRRLFFIHTATRRWRHPLRESRRTGRHRGAGYPAEKDIWIWDSRSVQAVAALTSRSRHRHYPLSRGVRIGLSLLRAVPPLLRNLRAVRKETFAAKSEIIPADRIVVAVAGRLSDLDREIERLRALRISGVLLRFYHHAGENERKEARTAFDRLSAAGFDIRVALVQDRKAVKHPDDWERFCRETLTHVRGRVRWVEFAHAVNRVKWGAWGFEDYRRLCEGLPALKKEFADISFAGPAVIDFDPAFALAALDALPKGVGWDAFSVHLYVDRRGAPENRQALLDLPGKLELMRAIARRAGMGDDRVIISEFNWPLAGTGVWSPVGSPYVSPGERVNDPSVSEEDYARFLVRYLLLALASGHVRDCVIWRLTAHGFGLVDDRDPGPWRPRPAFYALEVLLRFLDGAIFRRAWTPCRAPGVFALEFEGSRTGRTIVAWSHPADSDYLCPFQPEAVFDMFGNRMAADSPVVGLDASPVYLLEKQITDL